MKGFLYGQTEYNILDNACHLDEYVKLGYEKGYDYLSITDRNLHGHLKFYEECLKYKIKPIIGLEVSLKIDIDADRFLLYPYTNKGYNNLLKISTLQNLNRLDMKTITKYLDDIYVILVINNSFIEASLKNNLLDESKAYIEKLENLFKDNLYLGITYQDESKTYVNDYAISLARNLNIKALYIHQQKYLLPEDKIVYETLVKIAQKEVVDSNIDYSFLNITEDVISKYLELIEETNKLVSSINLELLNKKISLPHYKLPQGEINSFSYLEKLTNKGLRRRLVNNLSNLPKYLERLNYELSIIKNMNFVDYFLIVWDFIRYAKKNNILVGPGRGSAAGSLVAYTLGITEIDPLKYGLFFERFLNPERLTMPDIDTDFPDTSRDLVIRYVQDFYGKQNVSTIVTYGTFSVKSSLRDCGRVLKIESKRLDIIAKMLKDEISYDKLLEDVKDDADIYNLVYILKRLDGLPRNTSTHAAGIIIYDNNLTNVIPLSLGLNDVYQSDLEANYLEKLGLLKIDFLGLKNLTIIENILNDLKLDQKWLRNIPLNDKKTYNLLAKADTLGIFQMESTGIRNVLKKLKPSEFNDIVAVLALYRPGPMDNIDTYISRKNGEKFTYLDKSLEPILKETYGVIVYQEQIMQIAAHFAGYSLGEADILRRAVSKKNHELLEKERERFIAHAIKKGNTKELSNAIYDYIVKFANYGFNKAHSVAYAMLVYQMAYLKANYFSTFMANILNNVIGANETMKEYLLYARQHNLRILPPNINMSNTTFTTYKGYLIMPFTQITRIGSKIALEIINERKKGLFKDYNDFRTRINPSDQVLEALVFANALDNFKITKREMLDLNQKNNQIDSLLNDPIKKNIEEFDSLYLEEKEKEFLGFNLKYDPLKRLIEARRGYKTSKVVDDYRNKAMLVMLKDLKEFKSKKGTIVKGTLFDETLEMPFVIFNNVYSQLKFKFDLNKVYFCNVSLQKDETYGDNYIINEITPI